ncbi:T9SS type A sorting domain-containing protein [Maribellus comscasis]|uniref:T9SS type A sorting domain-containing protein n=1 Tax=Maribellus comscasis TaxID=2681766 RepID=A0A6I6K307_9BACT|nr:T9SS type A sorting domain-containing protein [Maribellus comscasis]QGY44304.1 T9SS type A sorting domain-containing protein [Maribellus comscasis]
MKRYRLYYKNFGIVQESIRSSFKTVLFIFLFAIWETSLFAQTTPSGIETQGNTTIENSQLHPKIAADTTGNFVLVWESFNEDGDDYGVFGQRFNNSGTKVGSQFQINATTNNAQSFPDVAMDENGNFTVVWMSEKEDGDGWGTYIRGYDDTGSSVFGPTLANTTTAGEQRFPTISTGGGNTVVTWMEPQNDGDIFARIFDSSGNPANPPFLVNTVTAGFQGFPTIAVDSAGNFVIAWQDNAADGDGIGIQAQRFDDTGSIDGTVISVNTTTTGNQQEPQVAKTQDGKFAVSWSSYGQDSDHFGVFARLFDNSGTALTSEILVNTETTGAQENESIVAMMDGKYAVSWSSYAQDSSFTGAYMQILNDDGSFYGSETRLNTTTFGFQHFSDLASSNAKLHAVWQDGMRNTTESTDGDDYGINFQLFSSSNPPVAVCQDITIYLDNSGSAEITGQDIDGGSTDDIGIASLLADPSSFTCENIGSNDVTLTVINTNGNVDTCHANVTVVDTVSPLAVCQNITIYLDISGYASIDATDLNGGSTDNCEIQDYQIIAGQTEFNCLDANKIFTVDLQVNDIYGNSSFCTSDVAIADTGLICSVPPQLPPAPADVTVPSPDSVPNQTDLTAVSSNCGGDITVSPVDSVIPGSCVNDFIILRTWTFVDSCGNSNNITQTITVIDTIVPIPPTPPADVYASCADDIPPPINLTAIDNNDGPITVGPTIQITPGSCPNDFVMIRTWTFADTCGNFSSVSQNIVVVDSVAPAAPIPPADLVLDCAADVPPPVKLTAIDNCDDSITVSPTIQITPGSCPNDFVMIRTWTFADTCGNFSSVSQTITVLDTLPPVPQAPPADLVLDCAAEVPPPVNLTATDNCGGEITVSPATTVLPGSCPNDFVMIRTWTFADTCGNFSSVSQTITVLDTLPPVPQAPPADLVLDCAAEVPPPVNLTATDNCGGEITVSPATTVLPGSCPNDFVMIRTWTFADTCGNFSSVSQTITVLDTLPPVPQAPPADLVLDCAAEVPPPVNLTATDNCGGEITVSPATTVLPGSCPNDFVMIRTWTFADTCGNFSSVSQTITVLDTLPPVPQAPPADLVLDCAAEVPPPVNLTATDNCGGEITVSPATTVLPGSCPNDFVMIRTWTFADTCGNFSSVSQTITVLDTLPPVPQAPPADLVLDCAAEVPPPVNLTATDNCGGEITVSPATTVLPGSCPNDFVMIRTWTFADTCGNFSSVSQTITVLDTIAPVIGDCPSSDFLIPFTNLGECYYTSTGDEFDISASDNCSSSLQYSYILSEATTGSGSQTLANVNFNAGVTQVSWTVRDECGNSSTCAFNINVNKISTISSVSVNPLSQQYSDSVEFTATITPWDCNDNNFIGGDVTFYIGNQPVGSPVNIQSDGTAIAKYPLIENPSFPSNGEMAPGNHLVTAMFNNYDIIYDVNDATTSIEITKENACYSYTGQLFASVGKNFEHNVYMAATIYDEMDGSQGDIRNSMARFVVSDAGIVYTSPWLEIGLVDPNDSTVGYISHNWIETVLSKTNTSEVYTVSVELSSDSYFELCSGEESVLTIYVPDGEFITGGGYLINNSPDGLFAADPDSKTNFGFNVKWNKQATNLQGKMNIIFRKTDGFGVKHIYQVKTNATNSLGIDVNNDCDSAEFVSKANLTDITNPLNPVSLGGNLELQVTLSDCSQNGEFDKMGISVWDNNGNLIYSSNWTGYETVKQVIEAGNIVIHSNSNLGTQSNAKKSAEILFPEFRSIDLKVYPNPFSEKLKFEFVSPEDTKSTVELYDITGRKISTVFEGQVKGNIKYNIEFVPTNAVSGMYLYKVIIGNTVYNGNVIYKKRF